MSARRSTRPLPHRSAGDAESGRRAGKGYLRLQDRSRARHGGRIDIPAKVNGVHVRAQHPRAGDAARARHPAARPGRLTRTTRTSRSASTEKSIAHIQGAQVIRVGISSGSSRRRVRRDPAAAQLKVSTTTNPIPARPRATSGKRYRGARRQGADPGPDPGADGRTLTTALAGAAKVVSGSFAHHYQGHMPIAPPACVADVQKDRATIWSSTQNAPNLTTDLANVLAPLQAEGHPRSSLRGGGELRNRRGHVDTPSRGDHVERRSQAGPRPSHSLGRAGLGRTMRRRASSTSVPASTRMGTSSLRLDAIGTAPGRHVDLHLPRAARHAAPGATAGNAIPTSVAGR